MGAEESKHVGHRRLLMERRACVTIRPFELFEDAGVLDGDHGLVCEGLEDRSDLGVERVHFVTEESNTADPLATVQQRDGHEAANAGLSTETC